MKYQYVEIQASLLVELLLNDSVERNVCAEIEEVISANASDHTALAYAVYDRVKTRKSSKSLRELLNLLSERGEIEVLSIHKTDKEIMVRWCGMVGCIIYCADRNTWEMHT